MFEGVKPDVIYTAMYDKNCDKRTSCLGTSRIRRQDELRAEHKTPITEDHYIYGKQLNCTYCKILHDMGTGKSFMSETFNLNCPSLHSLPKLVSRMKNILVGNGQYISALFFIPVVINLHEHRFEVYTLASMITDNLDMVMGIKNVHEMCAMPK